MSTRHRSGQPISYLAVRPKDGSQARILLRNGRVPHVWSIANSLEWSTSDGVLRCIARATREQGISIETDPIGMTPLYKGESASVTCWSDCPATVAATIGAPSLDASAILLEYIFGFTPGTRTLFEGVSRVGPAGSGMVSPWGADASYDRVADIVAKACREGHWLELTSGVDSQLVLAIAIASGVKPRMAITIGGVDSYDVQEAERVSRELGIAHTRVEFSRDRDSVREAAGRATIESRFGVNPIEIAHVYASLDSIDGARRGQISGVGGEAAGGFYSIDRHRIAERWMPHTVFAYAAKYAPAAHKIFLSARINEVLSETKRWWLAEHMSAERFYTEQRLPRWAAPVLVASSCRYDAVTPLLTSEYREWISRLPGRGRERQIRAIAMLAERAPVLRCLNSLRIGHGALSLSDTARRLAAASGIASRSTPQFWTLSSGAIWASMDHRRARDIAETLGMRFRDEVWQHGECPADARAVGLLYKCLQAIECAAERARELQQPLEAGKSVPQ